jgi:hypothetical protein
MRIIQLVLALFFLAGCAKIPLPPCSVPTQTRCDGTVAQRCAGGHWYKDMDCASVDQACVHDGEKATCE